MQRKDGAAAGGNAVCADGVPFAQHGVDMIFGRCLNHALFRPAIAEQIGKDAQDKPAHAMHVSVTAAVREAGSITAQIADANRVMMTDKATATLRKTLSKAPDTRFFLVMISVFEYSTPGRVCQVKENTRLSGKIL